MRALRADAAVRDRRHRDGRRQRPHRPVPRARDALDRAATCWRRATYGRRKSQEAAIKYFVARRHVVRVLPLRHRARLRRDRVDEPRHDRAFLADNVLLENGAAARRPRPAARRAAASRSPRCRSTRGSPTCTRARRHRSRASWHRPRRRLRFAALLRVFDVAFDAYQHDWKPVIWALAVLSDAGRLGARHRPDRRQADAGLLVDQPRRVHPRRRAGGERRGNRGGALLPPRYTFMVLGSFAIVTLVGPAGDGTHDISTFAGSRAGDPLSCSPSPCSCSQAGVPLTSGFFAKFYVIEAAVDSRSYALAVIAMVSAVIAAFLYLRLIVAMYLSEPEGEIAPTGPRCPGARYSCPRARRGVRVHRGRRHRTQRRDRLCARCRSRARRRPLNHRSRPPVCAVDAL